eukprot:m.11660 g.11660  ORF g.11660 m.11660 type:complete len:348 (+) comp3867_c0_seq2:116-1159(+)
MEQDDVVLLLQFCVNENNPSLAAEILKSCGEDSVGENGILLWLLSVRYIVNNNIVDQYYSASELLLGMHRFFLEPTSSFVSSVVDKLLISCIISLKILYVTHKVGVPQRLAAFNKLFPPRKMVSFPMEPTFSCLVHSQCELRGPLSDAIVWESGDVEIDDFPIQSDVKEMVCSYCDAVQARLALDKESISSNSLQLLQKMADFIWEEKGEVHMSESDDDKTFAMQQRELATRTKERRAQNGGESMDLDMGTSKRRSSASDKEHGELRRNRYNPIKREQEHHEHDATMGGGTLQMEKGQQRKATVKRGQRKHSKKNYPTRPAFFSKGVEYENDQDEEETTQYKFNTQF